MFGWFRPTCPVDSYAKQWIEERLAWLTNEFGRDRFLDRDPILPLQQFFPEPYDGSDESVQQMFDRVCMYMGVDQTRVQLEYTAEMNQNLWFVNDRGEYLSNGAAGLYYGELSGVTVISLDRAQFDEPMHLVATMAHELSHLKLMGENRVSGQEFDNELLTDLTAVFHGFGVFLASSPRAWIGEFGTWPWTKVRRPEYMSHPMYGYTLAHIAWFHGEKKPAWAQHLRGDVRAAFRQGVRWLFEVGDSKFSPANHALEFRSET